MPFIHNSCGSIFFRGWLWSFPAIPEVSRPIIRQSYTQQFCVGGRTLGCHETSAVSKIRLSLCSSSKIPKALGEEVY
jgi:hypothetical protein